MLNTPFPAKPLFLAAVSCEHGEGIIGYTIAGSQVFVDIRDDTIGKHLPAFTSTSTIYY